MIPVYRIKIPGYISGEKPDWVTIGAMVDRIIKKHFMGRKVAIRCLGSQEHPGKSADDMVKIIKKLGHDRYDPERKGDRYENVQNKNIDIFAIDFTVCPKSVIVENFIEPFWTWPPKLGRDPVRLDIVILYDRTKLRRVLHRYEGRTDIKKDGFIFKDQENRKDALMGIIKIL
jgi:hypothetical protein